MRRMCEGRPLMRPRGETFLYLAGDLREHAKETDRLYTHDAGDKIYKRGSRILARGALQSLYAPDRIRGSSDGRSLQWANLRLFCVKGLKRHTGAILSGMEAITARRIKDKIPLFNCEAFVCRAILRTAHAHQKMNLPRWRLHGLKCIFIIYNV